MSAVPCNGCTICCRGQVAVLFADAGDDIASYETQSYIIPGTDQCISIVRTKPNGDCIYVGESGCTIYERRPQVCRGFDCRMNFKKYTRQERRAMGGGRDSAIFARGRELLHTLTGDEI